MFDNSDKKVTVRIPLAIDIDGNWIASGSENMEWDWDDFMEGTIEHLNDFQERYWITAELTIPKMPETSDPKEISGSVEADYR